MILFTEPLKLYVHLVCLSVSRIGYYSLWSFVLFAWLQYSDRASDPLLNALKPACFVHYQSVPNKIRPRVLFLVSLRKFK